MDKFEFDVPEKYKRAVEWSKSGSPIDIDNKENMKLFSMLWEFYDMRTIEQEKWLAKNQDELVFEYYFEDLGYIFADVLTVSDLDGNEVYNTTFEGDGQIEEFFERLGISPENYTRG